VSSVGMAATAVDANAAFPLFLRQYQGVAAATALLADCHGMDGAHRDGVKAGHADSSPFPPYSAPRTPHSAPVLSRVFKKA